MLLQFISIISLITSHQTCSSYDLTLYRSGAVVSCHFTVPVNAVQDQTAVIQLPFQPSDESSLFFDVQDPNVDFTLQDYTFHRPTSYNHIFDDTLLLSLVDQDVFIREKNENKIRGRLRLDHNRNVRIETSDEESTILLQQPSSITVLSTHNTPKHIPCSESFTVNISFQAHPINAAKTETGAEKNCDVVLHYAVAGLSWAPKYRLLLSPSLGQASLEMSAVSSSNAMDARCSHRSRSALPKLLRFVTGDAGLSQQPPIHHRYESNKEMARVAYTDDSGGFSSKSLSVDADVVGDRVSFAPLVPREHYILPLAGLSSHLVMAPRPRLSRHPLEVEKVLSFEASMHHAGFAESDEQDAHPTLLLRIKNTLQNNLGRTALPSGNVDVYRDPPTLPPTATPTPTPAPSQSPAPVPPSPTTTPTPMPSPDAAFGQDLDQDKYQETDQETDPALGSGSDAEQDADTDMDMDADSDLTRDFSSDDLFHLANPAPVKSMFLLNNRSPGRNGKGSDLRYTRVTESRPLTSSPSSQRPHKQRKTSTPPTSRKGPTLLVSTALKRDVAINGTLEIPLGGSAVMGRCKWTDNRETPEARGTAQKGIVTVHSTQQINKQLGLVPTLEITDTLPFWGELLKFVPSIPPQSSRNGRTFKWVVPFVAKGDIAQAVLTYSYQFKQ